MKNEGNNTWPVRHHADASQDAALIIAIHEQYRRAQQAAIRAAPSAPRIVPPPPPVISYEGSTDAAIFAAWEAHRRRSWSGTSAGPVQAPEDDFPVLVSQSVIIPYAETDYGQLIRAATFPLFAILRKLMEDPSRMFGIDPRTWEKIVAASYEASGLFDEVTLTPRSGDDGRDVIAVKRGFWSMRVIESVKRYKPGHVVTAGEVRDLLGALQGDHQASKGVVSTTSDFAPNIEKTPQITQYMPHRLELLNGTELINRFKEYTSPRSK